jgi:hypothetical protein
VLRWWLAGSATARAFSEREQVKRCATGSCQCIAGQGEGAVVFAAGYRTGVREERG